MPLAPPLNYPIPVFDIDAWLVETGLMPEWYLPDRGAPLSDSLRSEFVAMWRERVAHFQAKYMATAAAERSEADR